MAEAFRRGLTSGSRSYRPERRRSAAVVPGGGTEWRVDLQEGVFGR